MSDSLVSPNSAVPSPASVSARPSPDHQADRDAAAVSIRGSAAATQAPPTAAVAPIPPPPAASNTASTPLVALGPREPIRVSLLDQHLNVSSFKEPAHQVRQAAYWAALKDDHEPRTAMEKIWLRDMSELQVKIDLHRRAVTTLIALHSSAAAREILQPNYTEFAPGGPRYQPKSDAYEGFMASGGHRVERMSDLEALAKAEEKLASEGLRPTGVTEVSLGLLLSKTEAFEKCIAGLEARRDRLYEDFLRSVERRERRSPPPAAAAEVSLL